MTKTTQPVTALRDLIDRWQTRNGDGRSTLPGGGRTACIRDLTEVLHAQYGMAPWAYVVRLHTPAGDRWLGNTNALVDTIADARLWATRLDADPYREQADRAYPAFIDTTEPR